MTNLLDRINKCPDDSTVIISYKRDGSSGEDVFSIGQLRELVGGKARIVKAVDELHIEDDESSYAPV